MNKKEMIEKRVALVKQLEELTKGKEQLTDEERKTFDGLESQIKTLDADIKRAGTLESVKNPEESNEMKVTKEAIGEVVKLATALKDFLPGDYGPVLGESQKKDIKRYSIREALRKRVAKMTGEGQFDGVELEMHQEGVKEMQASKLETQGIAVPSIIFNPEKRGDLKATVDAAGGYTVATEMGGLISTLRNSMVVIAAGGDLQTGLVGDVAFPRRATDSTATWRSEGGISTQSDPTYEQLTMTPKRLTTHTEYTHQLLRQSSISVDREVEDTLYYSIANALETAVFTGSGTSNQPTGLFASAINNGDHGSNGTVLNWGNVVQLESMVATDNALRGRPAYITNATAAGKMKQTLKSTYQGGFIWEIDSRLTPAGGTINGYPAYVTNVISNALTRGTGTGLSALVFGNWNECIIGQWGAIDLIVNPYSLDTYGTVRVTIAGYYDLGFRHVQSFAAIEGLETA
jgi:HK97 family phage major capsid protein